MIRAWLKRRREIRESRERLLYLLRVWRHVYKDEVWSGTDPFLFHIWIEVIRWRALEQNKWL